MYRILICFVFLITCSSHYAQEKKPLKHEDYDLWKRIENAQISDDGKTVISTVATATGRGDGYIRIFNVQSGRFFDFANAYRSRISGDGRYVFFLQKPPYELRRQEKKKDLDRDERTKDDLFIFDVRKAKLIDSVSRVRGFKIPEEGSEYLVIQKYEDLEPKKKKTQDSLQSKKSERPSSLADYALVYNLQKKQKDTIFRIKDFELPQRGPIFSFSTTKGKKNGDIGVYLYNVNLMKRKKVDTGNYRYAELAIGPEGKQIAYLTARDSTDADSLKLELVYSRGRGLVQITDTLGKNLMQDWRLSPTRGPYFSENGERLYFSSRPVRVFDRDTSMLEEEIPEVDVWTYRDKMIQPEQKSRLKELQNKAYLSFFQPETGRVVQLNDKSVDNLLFDDSREQRFILGYTNAPYRLERSWEYPWLKDFYIIDTRTGERVKAIEAIASEPQRSPDGHYAVYFDQQSQDWWSLNLRNNKKTNLTEDLPTHFYDEENDVPALPQPYGYGGWTKDNEVLLFDRYDIWSIPIGYPGQATKITQGREEKVIFRSLRLDRENPNRATHYEGGLLLTTFDEKDKSEALISLSTDDDRAEVVIPDGHYHLGNFDLAENSEELLFRKQNFKQYPDLYLLPDPGAEPLRITKVNPQQKNYLWGQVELFRWKAYDGTPLEGLIYKPENFDPDKKYPMITYFYEKKSDDLHRYYSPQPSASVVNFSFLTSNGYVVFVPDIVYSEGQPGKSAYNSVVSGVEAVADLGFVDTENLGIQGQSWGGYQVAHLITETDIFDAAMAGAPVSNMTSAYGGIRWESGLSRAFQYEETQSRIGKNLWEGLDLYIENSPLFGIPEIETPLLIMHNDEDGAVPYYQGIELFMGMRRLNKPVWLLVYNDEGHNLRKMKNRLDLSIRMMQFFDHFLKDAPPPEWMVEGIPAVRKGKDLGYDLVPASTEQENQGSD